MASVCRRRGCVPLICCVATIFILTMVWYENQRLFSTYVRTDAPTTPCVCDNINAQKPNHTKNVRSTFMNRAQNTVKNVFNFGEFMRDRGTRDDHEVITELSQSEIEELKLHNLCPEPYRLSEEFLKEHDKITPVSNWTIARNKTAHKGSEYYANASIVNQIIDSKPRIVILTPISNAAVNLQHYFKLVCSLSYPHALISVVLGEDSSTDRSFELAHVHSRTLKRYFSKVEVVHFEEELGKMSHFGKHDEFFQLKRRGHMARARNQLLFHGLRDEDYVMWMDADVKYIPRDIIEHLLSANTDVIVPSCMFQAPDGTLDVYDRNSSRDTPRSLEFLRKQGEDYLRLEGYTLSMRDLLPNIKGEGHLVSIDGVGGCVMLVKGECHRKGLIFPSFIFQQHIETEGLAKMAKSMDYGVFGYPMVFVFHR